MPNHIEIMKEDIGGWGYRFRSFPNAPRPPVRNVQQHGNELKKGLATTIKTIAETRSRIGVSADRLLIVELVGEEVALDIDLIQNKLGLTVVEELGLRGGVPRILIQFDSAADIREFEKEREKYENENHESGLLTYRQRSDLFSCIANIRPLSCEDRTGERLASAIASDSLPDGLFIVDIDVWFDGNIANRTVIENSIQQALGTGNSTLMGDLFALPNILLGRARVNRFTLESLRNLDLIALVDFPLGLVSTEQCELYSADFTPSISSKLDESSPLACVIDSGIFAANPLLRPLLVGEEDFNLTEGTPSDINGHGTGVAGIVAYGDFHDFDEAARVFQPHVRLCSAKVMHNEQTPMGLNNTAFPEDKRPEELVAQAIRYFNREYNCRVFNLSCGNSDRIYNGGRQMTWASLIDQLCRELDLVVIVSAGNVASPTLDSLFKREDFARKCCSHLLSDHHRIIDPATAALAVTVGSITRYEEPINSPKMPTQISAGKKDYPSVFTRTGLGVNNAIKPEFVDYGGNLSIQQQHFGKAIWRTNQALNEPTLNNSIDRVFKGWQGTSFAAPHVTHMAARLERALEAQIGESPSANLIRALLASSAKTYEKDWVESVNPVDFDTEKPRQPQKWRMRMCGYGKVDASTLFTDRNHVTLFAEDALDLKQIHLYKVPVPAEFLSLRTTKRISVGFAFNPPTMLNRRAYIANSLWFEVFRRIDIESLLNYKGKRQENDDVAAEAAMDEFVRNCGAPFLPGHTEVRNSTLQQRVWETGPKGGKALLWDDNDPNIYLLVTGKAKFKHPYESEPQPYAISITFSFDNEEDIQLQQRIAERARIKERQRIVARTQIQL